MKHLYNLLFLTLLMPNIGLAQGNLIPNASFEDTVSCPYGAADINALSDWYNAGGSPDYFHPCANSTTPQNGVPQNTLGFQLPYNGEAYAGGFTHKVSSPNMREYLGVQLQQPLVIGTEYFVSAYISKGDASSSVWNSDCGTNKFGFRFSTVKYDEFVFTSAPPDNFSHVYSDDVITDSINWVQISGSFIADSAYTYLRIGNFYDISNTTVTPCAGEAYYFIDNVCVSTSSTTCEVTVGLPILNQAIVQLYPNPTNNALTIRNLTGNQHYSILNSTGITVKAGAISEADNTVDVSAFANGMYFLHLNNKVTYKFFICH